MILLQIFNQSFRPMRIKHTKINIEIPMKFKFVEDLSLKGEEEIFTAVFGK